MYRVEVSTNRQEYKAGAPATPEEVWDRIVSLTTSDSKVVAAALRGYADRIDPPGKANY